MGMFTRINDIIQSNINALLDKAEDPEKMIRLIIQEMQETLVEIRTLAAQHIAEQKHLNRQIDNLEKRAAHWQENAELAVSKGKDDLARAALKEKKELEAKQAELQEQLQVIDEALLKVQDDTGRLNEKLDDAKAKQKALILRAQTVESRYKVKRQINKQNIDEAFTKFELFQRRMDELEGQVEALDVGRTDLASEIDQLAKDDAINEELNRMKEEMSSKK